MRDLERVYTVNVGFPETPQQCCPLLWLFPRRNVFGRKTYISSFRNLASTAPMTEKIIWVNTRSNRIDPMECLCCILPFSPRWHYENVKGFAQSCSQLEMKHHSFLHKTAFFFNVQPEIFHALTGQKQTNKENDPKPNPWPLAGGPSICTLLTTYLFQPGLCSCSQGSRQWMGHSL